MSAFARFFHKVHSLVVGQPPLEDHFDQNLGALTNPGEQAARTAFGSVADRDPNRVYVDKPPVQPWQAAEQA